MAFTTILSSLLTLLAGIGIFLIACTMMSTNLESASSKKLKALFAKASGSKLLGVGIGTVATAAIQSSGATTVMTIGFVNAGIISLAQAATIIYGANIGTTVTAQIVALGMFGGNSISTSVIFSAFAGLGAFMLMFCKKNSAKTIGGILAGFGMLFVGLTLMSGSMKDIAAMEGVKIFLAKIGNPVLLVLIGAIFTAIIQSSSVMTSIALTMVVTDLITLDQGIFLTMGSNIGSCVVAIIAGITSGKNAKRTSLIHLFFNCFGVIVFLIAALVLSTASGHEITFGTLFDKMFPGAPSTQLAMFHTVFNVLTVCIMLPLSNALVALVCKIIPDRNEETAEGPHFFFVDNNMLKTPPIAVSQTKKEIENMAQIALGNFDRAMDIISTLDFSSKDEFAKEEKQLNYTNKELVNYVVILSEKRGLNEHDHKYLATTFRTIRDLERIGDYAENITEYATNLKNSDMQFSDNALYEISQLRILVHNLFDEAMVAYRDESIEALVRANKIEDLIDDFTKEMEDNHIKRLSKGICTPTTGAQYLELSSDVERIADHIINFAKSITAL